MSLTYLYFTLREAIQRGSRAKKWTTRRQPAEREWDEFLSLERESKRPDSIPSSFFFRFYSLALSSARERTKWRIARETESERRNGNLAEQIKVLTISVYSSSANVLQLWFHIWIDFLLVAGRCAVVIDSLHFSFCSFFEVIWIDFCQFETLRMKLRCSV